MLVERHDIDRISVLVLNNPPANGYSHAMHRELDNQIVDLRADSRIDVIVIRGEGDKFFCAGADINYLRGLSQDEKFGFCLHANETLLRLENTPKLVIAALNGHTVGGGLEIALACDIRIGRTGTLKPDLVGLPEVSLGVLPGTGGTQRLTRILGRARALEMMVEGKNLSMDQAVLVSLVHRTFAAKSWWEDVLTYARSFCRPHRSAAAVGLIKRAVLGGADLPLEAGLALERELQMRLFAGPDAREGLDAFIEKRPPNFGERAAEAPVEPMPAKVSRPEVRPQRPPLAPAAAASPPTEASTEPPIGRPDPRANPTRIDTLDQVRQADERFGRVTTLVRRPGTLTSTEDLPGLDEEATPRRTPRPTSEGYFDGAFDSHTGRAPTPAGETERALSHIKDAVLNLVPRSIVERYMLIPVRREGDVLTIAMADTGKVGGVKAVEEETGLKVKVVASTDFDISAAIVRYYRA